MNEDLMITDDDLVIMLRHIELYFQSGLTKDSYCIQNNVTINTFNNILQAFAVLNYKSSNSHKKMMVYVSDYLTMPVETNKEVYCKNHKINLNTFKGYLRSRTLIDRATGLTNGVFDFMALSKAQKWPKCSMFPKPQEPEEIKEMAFIEVPPPPTTSVKIYSEFPKTQNNVQISIPCGISVSLPPSTTQESVIKIIELLKDL